MEESSQRCYLLNRTFSSKEIDGRYEKKIGLNNLCDFVCLGFFNLEEARELYPDGEFVELPMEGGLDE